MAFLAIQFFEKPYSYNSENCKGNHNWYSIFSFTLQGGKTLLEGGEYMIKAVSAVAYNVALLAQNFNEKLISLDEEVKK